jgi:molybdopterin molybdotransferase
MTPPRLSNDCFALPPGVDWTPVDKALTMLRTRLGPVVDRETLPVAAADGRVLAEAITAPRANPPTANSAVDGYGFAHACLGAEAVHLPLVDGRSAAGQPFDGAVPFGHAVRILTGAPVPLGVDTVILQEDVSVEGASIHFAPGLKKGANTRKAGEDVMAGATLFAAGTRLRPQDIALLAAVGVGQVAVYRPLRVGVLSTGDELRTAGEVADPVQIYDANRPMLLSMLARWGMEAVDLGHVGDNRDALRQRLDGAIQGVDAILTSGGASAGDEDHVSALLSNEGSLYTWRIAIKPGRPLVLGQWQQVPVFGLPGNPVAAFVCALIFARPALDRMSGAAWVLPQPLTLPAAFSKSKKAGRREYLRARLNAEGDVEVFASEGSGRISGLSWATGLVELDDPAREITHGDPVKFFPYGSFGL